MQSPRGILCKKGIHKKVCNVYKKHLCWSPFSIKLPAGGPQLYQKKIPAQVLSRGFCKIFKNKYFEEHLQMPACIEAHFF